MAGNQRLLAAKMNPKIRKRLTERNNSSGIFRLSVHISSILTLSSCIAYEVFAWPLLVIPLGVLITFLFAPEHEAIHQTAFKTTSLNWFTATLSGLLILLPPHWFRHFHFAHHRFTQNPTKDPELLTPKPETPLQYAIYLSGWHYWKGMIETIIQNAFFSNTDDFIPPSARAKVRAEARLHISTYFLVVTISLATNSSIALWCWLIPILVGQPFLRAFLLPEHTGCRLTDNMLENTRTTLTAKFISLLTWNMNYHTEHHDWPAVPFHRLKEYHLFLAQHLEVVENSYCRFHAKYISNLNR